MAKPEKIVSINTLENPSEAFDRIVRGVDLVANSVKQTLGPHGRNFLIEKSGMRVTNDGISIAREIQASDEVEDLAVRVFREACNKTNEDAGDGTTTTSVYAQAIINKSRLYMATGARFAKRSVISLKQQIEKECKDIIEKLKKMAEPITSKEELIAVAKVSVEDQELAELIGDAQWDLGKDGMIIVEENTESLCSVEKIQGIRIDNGLGTSMVMNDQEKQRLVLENVPILLTNHQIRSIGDIKPVLDKLIKRGEKDIVILARAFSPEAIQECMVNHENGIRLYPMNAPYVNQREVLKDMEAVLGGRYIHDEAAELRSVTSDHFGRAKKVIGYRYSAIFTGERTERVEDRLSTLREELKGEPSKFNKKMIEQRIQQMDGGFALLKIGSLSDIDRKYKFDKAEDAVNAVRSAFQEGTVRGAGLALVEIAKDLPEDALLKEAIQEPYNQIMANAGEDFAVEDWVRNSLKVERVALENACAIAGDIITLGGAIATQKIKPVDQMLSNLQK